MSNKFIDLYSDTKSKPTPEMRRAIADAEVGDEQAEEDPSVTQLLERSASLLGQEAAIFLPSGTMANEVAILVSCQPGDEIIAHENSHILNFEGGAAAALAGVMVRPVAGERGLFDEQTLKAKIRPNKRHLPVSRLVAIEQTTNLGGGAVWPLELMQSVVQCARKQNLTLHLDGARLMNASVASGLQPDDFGRLFDTVYLDFTKALGAPFGAVLAGKTACIERAWRWKQRLGGSMRQVGMMAAACLYSLDHHVDRIAQDHDNARLLANLLADVPAIAVDTVETNMVYFDVSGLGVSAEDFNRRLLDEGARMSIQGLTRLRAVTHLDIDREDIVQVAETIKRMADSI